MNHKAARRAHKVEECQKISLKWNCYHSAVAEGVLSGLGLRQAFVAKCAAARQGDGGLDEVDERVRKNNGKESKKDSCLYVMRVLTCLATLFAAGVCIDTKWQAGDGRWLVLFTCMGSESV